MADLIAGIGRGKDYTADPGDFLAALGRVASDGIAALEAATFSSEAATEACIALARLQLAFAGRPDLPSLAPDRDPVWSGHGLPSAVEEMVAAMNESDDRSGRPGVAALGLGLIVARCIATLRQAHDESDRSSQAASLWAQAVRVLAAASLDFRQQHRLPDGTRVLLRYALGSAEIDETHVPAANSGTAGDRPLAVSRAASLDAQEGAHAVLTSGSLLPVDPANAWHLRCVAGALMFLPVRNAPIISALSRPLLVGVVTRQRTEGGAWSPAYHVVTRPNRSAGIDIIVLSTAGNVVVAGSGQAAGESDTGSFRWSVRSVIVPGWVPFALNGSVDHDVFEFEDGRCAARRERQLVAPRRRTGPPLEEVARSQ